jgi:hypothetical protein
LEAKVFILVIAETLQEVLKKIEKTILTSVVKERMVRELPKAVPVIMWDEDNRKGIVIAGM